MIKSRLWLWLYKSLTWLILGLVFCLLPLIGLFKPKFGKWFRMRFLPMPLRVQPKVWVHAVSLGEIKIALALLEDNPSGKHPERVLLTTSTQSGYQFLVEKMGRANVRYLPWDLGFCYRRLFAHHRVPNLIVVETEIWPNLFSLVTGSGSKLVMVNARLSSRSLRLKNNALFRWTLNRTTRVAARSDLDRDRYLQFGLPADKVVVTGNIKYDFKPQILKDPVLVSWLEQEGPLLIFASISADEVSLLAPELERLFQAEQGIRVLWAPRHLRSLDRHLSQLSAFVPELRSKMSPQSQSRLLVLDSFGELAGCFRYGQISLIGGSFNDRGGQNFLESLQAGTPAIMGPATENFKREVAEALEAQTILCLENPNQVADSMINLLIDQHALAEMSQKARDHLARHAGAIARTTKVLIDSGIC